MTRNYAVFLYLNTIFAYFCFYRTFLKNLLTMGEHLALLQSIVFCIYTIIEHELNFLSQVIRNREKTSFEVCMLFCVTICRSITFIIYNFSQGFSISVFILQAHKPCKDDVILTHFITY